MDELIEIWNPVEIEGGTGIYEVSNLGRIRSTRVFPSEIVVRIRNPKLNNGYPSVTMRLDKFTKKVSYSQDCV